MKRWRIVPVFFFYNVFMGYSQGCSDAGVCSVGSGHVTEADSSRSGKSTAPSISLTASIGLGEEGTTIYQMVPELNIGINKRISIQARIPIMSIGGNLASVSGVGDVTAGFTFVVNKQQFSNTVLYLGAKIPLADANTKEENKSLPMPYQTSLGTLDFLGGVSYSLHRWNATIGYQQVLDNGNKNQFTRSLWSTNMDAQTYFESNGFIRGDDASFKIEYNVDVKKVSISPGVLAIYRLSKDQRLDTNNVHRDIKNSDGLTLNLTTNAQFTFGKKSTIVLQAGFPVIIREVRADGLTRSAVVNITYKYNLYR